MYRLHSRKENPVSRKENVKWKYRSKATAVHLSREAQRYGADGVLVVSPYYNKATQNGLYEHFRKIAEAIQIPVKCGLNYMGFKAGVPRMPLTELEDIHKEKLKRAMQTFKIL